MRLLPFLTLTLAATTALAGDLRDRGPGATAVPRGDGFDFPLAQFAAVTFGLPGQVDVRVGPAWSVHASGPAAAFANVRVARRADMLEIGHRRDGVDAQPLERQLRFTVTLPRLTALALGGSGRMTVDRVTGDALAASVGGSGTLTLGEVAVRHATVSIGGSGAVDARGSAERLTVNVGGSGQLRAPGLRAASATVSTAGAAQVRATVDGPAQVSTVGSGQIDLGPRARCTVTSLGARIVRCG